MNGSNKANGRTPTVLRSPYIWPPRAVFAPVWTAPSRSSSWRSPNTARPSMCAMKSSITAMWWRASRPRAPSSSKNWTKSRIPARPIVFSAHGVPKAVPDAAGPRNLFVLDATCPLVSKVHVEAERQFGEGHEILLIGHAGHPEVIGTTGQLPEGAVTLIETVDDALAFVPRDPDRLAVITQTTLSVDDTREIVERAEGALPALAMPRKDDICYATTNRQEAVKRIAPACDRMIVVGSPNSSNSLRLVEVAERAGCPRAVLIQRAAEIDWDLFERHQPARRDGGRLGARGARRRDHRRLQGALRGTVETVTTAEESIAFKLPRELREMPELEPSS